MLGLGEQRLQRRVAPLPGGIGTAKELVEDDEATVNAIVSGHAFLILARAQVCIEASIRLVIADSVPLWFTGLLGALSLSGDNQSRPQSLAS